MYTLETQSDSVVVSAAPQHVEFDTDSWKDSSEEVLSTQRRGYFADQFEVREFNYTDTLVDRTWFQNKSNFDAHFTGTGPEIWKQTSGCVDAFVAGAGASLLLAN